MRDELRNLMDALAEGIVRDEGFARELADLAHVCDQNGHLGVAEAMRTAGRQHRIRAMETRARLAAYVAFSEIPRPDR